MRPSLSPGEVYPARDPRLSARFISVNGRRLRVIEAGPENGPPVICIAGWASSAYQYRKNLPALAQAGFRSRAVELPGQGESDKPHAADFYTLPHLTRELECALDALALDEVAIVGQSLGAAVVSAFARRSPHRVGRMALLAPVGLGRVRSAEAVRRLLPDRLATVAAKLSHKVFWRLGLRLAYGKLARPTAEDVDEYYAPARDPAYVASLLALVRGIDWSVTEGDELAALAMPVLIMCGTADRLIRCAEVLETAKRLPNARSVVIPGAGHALQEEAPDEVNRALVDFLRL